MPIIHRARNPDKWTPRRHPIGMSRVDWSHPLARGLGSYWMPGNHLLDVTGKQPRGVAVGAPTTLISNVGPSMRFAGSQRVELGAPATYYTTDITLAVKASVSSSSGGEQCLIGRWFGGPGWGLAIHAQGDLIRAKYGVSGGDGGFFGSYRIVANRPFTAVASFSTSGSAVMLLVDDDLASQSGMTLVFSNRPMALGAWDDNGSWSNYLSGDIALAATWERALSASEMRMFVGDPYAVLIPAG